MKLLLLMLISLSAFAQNNNSYPLLCRGGYIYQLGFWGPGYHVVFRHSREAAGHSGRNLEAGTCAWIDRPLNNEEANRISIFYPAADNYSTEQILDMYRTCALDVKCVIKGKVRNAGDHFEVSFINPEVSIMTDRTSR